MQRRPLFICIVLSVLGALSTSARAELIYDGDTLTDTVAGLRFTRGQLPTATFMPAAGSTVATDAEFLALIGQVGIAQSDDPFANPAPFSEEIAELAWWLRGWGYFYAGPEPDAVCHGPNGGGNCFLGMGVGYQSAGDDLWIAYVAQTISRYGPTFSHPFSGWEQEFVPTLFVAPVPLPAAIWLTLSGLAIVGMKKRSARR